MAAQHESVVRLYSRLLHIRLIAIASYRLTRIQRLRICTYACNVTRQSGNINAYYACNATRLTKPHAGKPNTYTCLPPDFCEALAVTTVLGLAVAKKRSQRNRLLRLSNASTTSKLHAASYTGLSLHCTAIVPTVRPAKNGRVQPTTSTCLV